jgi:hypothetical protein
MNISRYFGQILAKETGINSLACSGLIRLSILDAKRDPDKIDLSGLKKVFNNELKSRLEKLRVKEIPRVVTALVNASVKSQSLLVMSVV